MLRVKVSNREDYEKISKLFKERIVTYSPNSRLVDVECDDCDQNDKDLMAIKVNEILNIGNDRVRRRANIDRLKVMARYYPIEPYVLDLIKHYKTEIDLYVNDESDDFENAVNNETVEPYLTYLNIVVEPDHPDYQPDGKKVRHSILEEITEEEQ